MNRTHGLYKAADEMRLSQTVDVRQEEKTLKETKRRCFIL